MVFGTSDIRPWTRTQSRSTALGKSGLSDHRTLVAKLVTGIVTPKEETVTHATLDTESGVDIV